MLTGYDHVSRAFRYVAPLSTHAMRNFCFTLLSRRAVDAPQLNRKESIFGGCSTIYFGMLGLMVRIRAAVRVWVRIKVMIRIIMVLEYCLGLPTPINSRPLPAPI